MIIKNQNKPTLEQIEQYKNKLETLLSAHKISIIITMRTNPIEWQFYKDGKLTETTYEWIDNIIIKNFQGGEEQIINLPEYHYNDEEIWGVICDAIKIYELYKKDYTSPDASYRLIFKNIPKVINQQEFKE